MSRLLPRPIRRTNSLVSDISNIRPRAVYDMNHEHRGYAIVFINFEFKHESSIPLNVIKEDRRRLKQTFTMLGFKVIQHVNMTGRQMKDKIDEYGKKNYYNHDCFVCVFSSHGGDGRICATDESVSTMRLYAPILECRSLKGKPKIFIIDACRGIESRGQKHYTNDELYEPLKRTDDCLFVYGNLPGKDSSYVTSNGLIGSYMIAVLCDNLKQYATTQPMVNILATTKNGLHRQTHHTQALHDVDRLLKTLQFTEKRHNGFALIFINHIFRGHVSDITHTVAMNDKKRLRETFQELHFNVEVFMNMTGREMKDKMDEYGRKDHLRNDYFVSVFSSYGGDGEIWAKDENVSDERLFRPIIRCNSLKGAPKLFVIDACRYSDTGERDYDYQRKKQVHRNLKTTKDCVFAYANFPGEKSLTSTVSRSFTGSYMIRALCQSLQNHGTRIRVPEFMYQTNLKLKKATQGKHGLDIIDSLSKQEDRYYLKDKYRYTSNENFKIERGHTQMPKYTERMSPDREQSHTRRRRKIREYSMADEYDSALSDTGATIGSMADEYDSALSDTEATIGSSAQMQRSRTQLPMYTEKQSPDREQWHTWRRPKFRES